jgi:hypothetical protein
MSGELKKPRTPMQLKHWLGRPPTVNVSKTIDLRVLSLRSTITIKQKKGALPSTYRDGGQHGFVVLVRSQAARLAGDDSVDLCPKHD